jgi:uncharacterized coiled-coil protein SlyX
MSENFTEENTKGEIISGDEEHDGFRWRNIAKIFRPVQQVDWLGIRRRQDEERRNRERRDREARERDQRARDEVMRVRNMENQVRQLSARVKQLENTIKQKDILIGKKNKHIAFLKKENTRLRKKVNSLLDNLQYYRTLVLGNKEVDGYKTTVVKQQIKNIQR